jgi:hypothetical protein
LKPLAKSVLLLITVELLILITGFIFVSGFNNSLMFSDIGLLSAVYFLITLVTLVIFFRGQGKEPASQTMHTLVSISLKFMAELIFAFIWFFVAKKTGLSTVVLFFVLYLTFTLFLVMVILKTLKYKSL